MAKGDDLQERLIGFAVDTLRLCETLPKTAASKHIADQLARSATAGAPNYAEARTGESLRDFVHKLGIVRKELNESLVWLRMLDRSGIGKKDTVLALHRECDELCRIVCTSKRTAGERLRRGGVTSNSEF